MNEPFLIKDFDRFYQYIDGDLINTYPTIGEAHAAMTAKGLGVSRHFIARSGRPVWIYAPGFTTYRQEVVDGLIANLENGRVPNFESLRVPFGKLSEPEQTAIVNSKAFVSWCIQHYKELKEEQTCP